MDKVRYSGESGSSVVGIAESARAQVRAVAFEIEGTVYAGNPGESHGALYTHLLLGRIVPPRTLEFCTAHEEDHGFVTETGEFLKRAEAFKRFGIKRSQDLTAQDGPAEWESPAKDYPPPPQAGLVADDHGALNAYGA